MIASGRLPSIKYRGIRLVPKDAEPKAPLIRGQNPYINYAKAKA